MAEGMHLAELNIGRLLAPVGDPKVAPFIDAIDRVNGLGKRMPGFVWMMEGSGEPGATGGPGNTDVSIGGDPQFISNLSVWEDVPSLEAFVWKTVHKQFYDRRREWFEVFEALHFVMWWVPAGHRPSLEEGLERLELLRSKGPTPEAFGWESLSDATLWREARCQPAEAG
ncbi:MAG: DUF3291 domain-containing protein [Pseudomonadota bacterium]